MSRTGKNITWNDIREAHQNDLTRVYRMDNRQLEQSLRRHLDGANADERRKVYETLYGKRSK